ncbi:DNA recombination protein RmuC [Pseudoclavibacter sp. AY1F1]|uniref:DNA recombination protein RmuC n=1 Tax=Pseudoclavibacter sp. AY1F1 TaxID=2080583 RepID=UPI000CE73ECF|nr:DNA recombination protein RmuC [Pseudoclavibacter sp. AY1F1]PPF46963.1 DNA recombination protein RmuC [Pseudoclavibacter sp. AY1F1]
MEPLPLVIGLLLGLVVGFAIATMRGASQRQLLATELAAATARATAAVEARATAERHLDEVLTRERSQLEARRSTEVGEQQVLTALAPVNKQLELMRRAVASIEEQRLQQHGELSEQLRNQHEADERLRATTDSLASALQSNQARGVWGEAQLRNIVEASGLIERVDFDTQVSVNGEQGARRPDMIVHLPGDKHLVIDAKAPMSKYLAASQLSELGDEEETTRRRALMGEHAKALKAHVAALNARGYPSAVPGSPELVIAFVPSESALSAAVAADPSLLEDAMHRGVAVTSPVSLWATLRAIAYAWQQDVLEDQAHEIFELSTQLHTRLGTLATHIDRLGRSLAGAATSYNAFLGSLETRVLPTARKLDALNIGSPINTPRPVDEQLRGLTAPELTESTRPGEIEPELTER